MERRHPGRGRGNIVGITVLVVSLIAAAAVVGVLFVGPAAKVASDYRGSLSMDASIKANDKWTVGVAGFGVSGDGTTMSAELGSPRISGSNDPFGEAGKAAVAAKRGEASGGDFTREHADQGCKVTWPTKNAYRGYANAYLRTAGR